MTHTSGYQLDSESRCWISGQLSPPAQFTRGCSSALAPTSCASPSFSFFHFYFRTLLCQSLWTQYFSFVLCPCSFLICIPTHPKASSIQNRSPCKLQREAGAGMLTLITGKAEIHHGTPPWPKGCLSRGFLHLCPQPPCCLCLQFISTFSGSLAPGELSTYCL